MRKKKKKRTSTTSELISAHRVSFSTSTDNPVYFTSLHVTSSFDSLEGFKVFLTAMGAPIVETEPPAGASQAVKDLFSGAVGGIAQVLIGMSTLVVLNGD